MLMKLKSYLNVNTNYIILSVRRKQQSAFSSVHYSETSHSLPWELSGSKRRQHELMSNSPLLRHGRQVSAEPNFFMEWNNEVTSCSWRSPAWVRLWHSLTSAWKTNIKAVLRRRPHCAWNNMLEGQIVWRQTVQNWSTRHPVDSEKPHAHANVENILSAALSTCATRQTPTCCIAFMHK